MFDFWPVYSGERFRASWPSCWISGWGTQGQCPYRAVSHITRFDFMAPVTRVITVLQCNAPLKTSLWKFCPLNNHHECLSVCLSVSWSVHHDFVSIHYGNCAITQKPLYRYFYETWYKYKATSEDMKKNKKL